MACLHELTTGIEGTLTFKFEPIAKETAVFCTVAYARPMALLTNLPEGAFTVAERA